MSSVTAPETPVIAADWLSNAFEGPIKRVWRSPLYVLGLLVVAAAMVLLPLIYVGLIALAGYGLYYHATANIVILQATHGLRGRLLVYVAPLAIGGILLLFMIKPLFARRARTERYVSLVRQNEPVLFDFVERLCETIGAPTPRRIDVDCAINASASFRKGFLSLLGRDLVLTIGASLVAGLTLRQFAGVLAHEFGHFSQGFGMRLTYVIHRVNAWFARVVYERDAWDEWLIQTAESQGGWMSIVLHLARLFVWLTRKILWLLMMTGHIISCVMMRQMEYSADRYAVRVAGSDACEAMMRRLPLLEVASQAVHADLWESWKDGRLADNFPALLVAKVGAIPKEVQAKIEEGVDSSKTGLFDTHPSAAARIRRAREENTQGAFRAEGATPVLFRDFDGFCKAVTFSYYQDLVGPSLTRQNLISTDALTRQQTEMQRSDAASARYFPGCLTPIRPLSVSRFSEIPQLPPNEHLVKLKRARAAVEKALPVVRKTYERYAEADNATTTARLAYTLLRSKTKFDPKELALTSADPDEAQRACDRAEAEKRGLVSELATIETVVKLRLECALALLNVDQVGRRLKDAEGMRHRSEELLDALACVHDLSDAMAGLRKEQPSLRAVYAMLAEGRRDEDLYAQARRVMDTQYGTLSEIRELLAERTYPFEHAEGRISMVRYAVGTLPSRDDIAGIGACAERILDNIGSMYLRVMGELATIAEAVESALGLPPLETGVAAACPSRLDTQKRET